MSQTKDTKISVKIVKSTTKHIEWQSKLQELNVPPRSRLYGLVPCGMGNIWSESLTSYINRLGWRHGIAPRVLAAQEIGPFLNAEWWNYTSPRLMGVFCAVNAMSLNGLGDLTTAWSTVLEQLTRRPDLHLLTSSWWIGDLPSRRNLRLSPAWCPACYTEWKQQGLPIYQPFLWMLQVITICPSHKRPLMQRCPYCQATQSVIVSDKTHAGECTKCTKWLGTSTDLLPELTLDDETMNWHQWVILVLEELQIMNVSSGLIRWKMFFTSLATGMKQQGSYSRLARLSGINREVLHRWTGGPAIPSFEMILKFCYVCDTTPLQFMAGQFSSLERAIQNETAFHPRQHHRASRQQVDRERCLEFIQAILDGREEPLGPYQVAIRLGYGQSSLWRRFPQECMLLTQLAQAYRKQQNDQRIVQMREKVRQEMMALHAQGVFPPHQRLRQIFPPGIMRQQEAMEIWHSTLRELGLEQ